MLDTARSARLLPAPAFYGSARKLPELSRVGTSAANAFAAQLYPDFCRVHSV
jgi:hypothetical protein